MLPRLIRTLALVLTVSLIASCGGDDGAPSPTTDDASSANDETGPSTTADAGATTTTEAAATATTAPSEPAADDEPEPEPEPDGAAEVALPTVEADDVVDLVVAWADGTGDPLDVARQLIGFPLDVAVPAGSAPYDVELRMTREALAEPARWEWSYSATIAAVGQIDADLPEGGPGTIDGRLHFDPLFTALGWRNVSQVISDPSSGAGGPQSVNWAYEKNDPVLSVDGIETEVVVGRAWVDEDLDFRDGDDVPGHAVEITLRTLSEEVLVPFLTVLDEALPIPEAHLTEAKLSSYHRLPDSYSAAEGLRYLEVELVYIARDLPEDQLRERLGAGLDGTVFLAGEESFFDEGFIEPVLTDPLEGDWRQPVVFLSRYPGAPVFDTQAMIEVTVTLEPNRELLQLLPED